MIKFRPYQQPTYDDIMLAYEKYDKILAQCETGWGKSILIGALANRLPGRTLVLTHRIELLNQNSEWIDDLGILTAKVKKVLMLKYNKCVISMAQTCAARFDKYGPEYIGQFDNVLCDEIHVDFFKKVYDQIKGVKVIAVTATPIINKNETKSVGDVEYIRKLTMKDEFDILIQGVGIQELIDLEYLTRDFNIQLTPPNLEALVSSNSTPDGYTNKSMGEVFGSSASIETVYEGYDKYAKGLKTLVFNPTTDVNKKMYDYFLSKGLNVRMYDSVNKVKGQTRKDVTNWFKSNDDAILLNVGVFTTGFSVNDLMAILYNKKTKSLSLYRQSAGRGCRVLNDDDFLNGKVKDKFIFLDMGLNINEHGKWSDYINWQKYFTIEPWKVKKEVDTLQIWECKKCGEFNRIGEVFNQKLEIIECGACQEPKPKKEQKYLKGEMIVLEKPIYPQAAKIIEYVKKYGGDASMGLKICKGMILDLFIFHTTKDDFIIRQSRYESRISSLYRPTYFAIMNDKELNGKNRRLSTEINEIVTKVHKYYNT
jgi:superfamily II DNA or RNA helicase